jgi:hypothetical protein
MTDADRSLQGTFLKQARQIHELAFTASQIDLSLIDCAYSG